MNLCITLTPHWQSIPNSHLSIQLIQASKEDSAAELMEDLGWAYACVRRTLIGMSLTNPQALSLARFANTSRALELTYNKKVPMHSANDFICNSTVWWLYFVRLGL